VEFLEPYDPPGMRLARTTRRASGLLAVQVGAIAEDELAIAIVVDSPGAVSVAMPLVDQGFDGYARRLRTLSVAPYQLKARRTLSHDGRYIAYPRAHSIRDDPKGHVIFSYLPGPHLRTHRKLWIIPTPYFIQHCPRVTTADGSIDQYVFQSPLEGGRSQWNRFYVDIDDLRTAWLDRIPGWKTLPTLPLAVAPAASSAFGGYGELWVSAQLELVGKNRLVVARERIDVDAVDLLLHDLRSYGIAGLQVKTATINADLGVQLNVSKDTFFEDDRLFVVILPAHRNGQLHETSFLVPSTVIPAITSSIHDGTRLRYQTNFRVDPPSEKFRPFAVPTAKLAAAILRAAFR
jgi:hypothetical protein